MEILSVRFFLPFFSGAALKLSKYLNKASRGSHAYAQKANGLNAIIVKSLTLMHSRRASPNSLILIIQRDSLRCVALLYKTHIDNFPLLLIAIACGMLNLLVLVILALGGQQEYHPQ